MKSLPFLAFALLASCSTLPVENGPDKAQIHDPVYGPNFGPEAQFNPLDEPGYVAPTQAELHLKNLKLITYNPAYR